MSKRKRENRNIKKKFNCNWIAFLFSHPSEMSILFNGTLIRVLIKFTVVQLITVALYLSYINKKKLFTTFYMYFFSFPKKINYWSLLDAIADIFLKNFETRQTKNCRYPRLDILVSMAKIHFAIWADKSLSLIHLLRSLINDFLFSQFNSTHRKVSRSWWSRRRE
jgi:hypothetical protein